MLRAILAQCLLTLVVFVLMYATRLPAMSRLKIAPQDAAHVDALAARLPSDVRRISDNYNHLHEAPTIFFAAVLAIILLGVADATSARLAWAYVATRAAHSAVQCTVNIVTLRFAMFALSWLALGAMIVRAAAVTLV